MDDLSGIKVIFFVGRNFNVVIINVRHGSNYSFGVKTCCEWFSVCVNCLLSTTSGRDRVAIE